MMTPVLAPFISLHHRFLYHQDGSALTVLAALWLNLVAIWLVFVAILQLAKRARWLTILFWAMFVAILPFLLLRDWAALNYVATPPVVTRVAFLFAVLFLLMVVLLWRRLLSPKFPLILSRVTALVGFLSLGWLVTLGQLALYTVEARNLNREPTFHREIAPASVALSTRPRVIWIIMDELGYEPAFVHRYPGLSLPGFDSFAAQSTQFTQAQAPGLYTEEVVPELLMGRATHAVAFTAAGTFTYAGQSGPWHTLDPQDTVFGDALRSGYSTAVIGWHNPYCRLLAPVLDQCFWIARSNSTTPDFDTRAPLLTNIFGPARHLWDNLRLRAEFTQQADRHDAALHIEDLKALLNAADHTLADPARNFVLIHLPVPHPSGIYDRHTGFFTTKRRSSYVDNLALADKILAQFRSELDTQGAWDSSTVLLMGDHSWRTITHWKGTRGWTAEDQMASHNGGYDPRPVFLLKLAGQHTAATWDRPFPTVNTRQLLDAIFSHQVQSPADLEQWAARH